MDLGVVLQCNPPASRVVDLARQAETHGFSHVWTFDSHLLWEEPYVIYSAILAATRKVIVGPMVTNPATRDWTVTASLFATLNEMYGNRTVCGIGRGDSAVRVTQRQADAPWPSCATPSHVIREPGQRRGGRAQGQPRCGSRGATSSSLDVWVAAYGPQGAAADRRGRRRLHPAAGRPVDRRVDASPRSARPRPTPAATPTPSRSASRHRRTSATTLEPAMRDQCRWFGGMVGNHVADIVARYGDRRRACRRRSPTTSRAAGLRLQRARPGREHARRLRARRDRRPVLRPRPGCGARRRLEELRALGVDQFAVYLQHDAKAETLEAYGETVIPAVRTTSPPRPDPLHQSKRRD